MATASRAAKWVADHAEWAISRCPARPGSSGAQRRPYLAPVPVLHRHGRDGIHGRTLDHPAADGDIDQGIALAVIEPDHLRVLEKQRRALAEHALLLELVGQGD